MKKTYVLDTNILMTSPNALMGFGDNVVVITGTTLQELDHHKTDGGERGFNAREAIRTIDTLGERGDLSTGVEMINGGILMLEPGFIAEEYLPSGYSLSVPDNRIISAAYGMKMSDKYKDILPVILVTNDISMRVNARLAGVEVQSYKNETVETDRIYTGKTEISLRDEEIDLLYANKEISLKEEFIENEYLLIRSESGKSALAYYRNGKVHLLPNKGQRGFGGIQGLNASQKMLMHALLAPASELPLVIVKGPAGTGKTLLAISCGLEKTYTKRDEREYDQILITRANVLSDNDLGFLPGDLEEKMSPLVAPFFDNMKTIFGGKERDIELAESQIKFVMDKNIVEIEAIGYIRGRSIHYTYLIVDEAQNMTPHQALEVVTRAGEGTKVILLGDPNQIDAKYLDKRNNGLVFASDKMKGSPYCAQITFEEDEAKRSALCIDAAKRMSL